MDARPIEIVLASEALLVRENIRLRTEVQNLECLLVAIYDLHIMDEAEIQRLQKWQAHVIRVAKGFLAASALEVKDAV